MANTIENSPEETEEKPSLIATIIPLLLITVLAGGAGFGVSAAFLAPATPTADAAGGEKPGEMKEDGEAKKEDSQAKAADSGGHGEDETHKMPKMNIVISEMPAITTNLADPTDAWIRLEAALVYEEESDEQITNDVHQDIVAYVRTLRLYNLRGGSGYQHLVEDLQERARIRSDGRVKRVLIRSLVIE
jgi:flagellar FliL protein